MLRTSKLTPGKRYTICEIIESPLSINFLEIGLLPGKTVELMQRAPFGGPLAFLVGDNLIALRIDEADLVIVEAENP